MSKKYISGFSKTICRMVLALLLVGMCHSPAYADSTGSSPETAASRHGIGEDYNPTSPGNPGATSPEEVVPTKYKLNLAVNPTGAGSAYANSYNLEEGAQTNVYCSTSSSYTFEYWSIEGDTLTTESSFYFTMPAHDVAIVANFRYNPTSPGNPSPEEQKVSHPVVVRGIPSIAGSFSPSGSFTMEENTSRTIYAYPNTSWKLIGWTINGVEQESAVSPITVTMEERALDIAAYFEFDPTSPANPGANYYNSVTGQAIVDDFTPGYLYDALNTLVGYGNFSNISSLIVKGEMTSNDVGNLSYFSNAAVIDLSRTGGVVSIPNYTFSGVKAASIVLPSTVTSLGTRVFDNCENLASLTVYAEVPPTCTTSTFTNFINKANCTVYVPASAIELYSSDEVWKEFPILPITSDVHTLQVNLPADASDGRYKNNSLEIVNVNSGVRQKYVISDRLFYTFNSLQKDEQYNIYMFSQSGLEIGRIENVTIPDQDFEVTFDSLRALFAVSASVATPDGTDVTGNVTIEWYKPLDDGTLTYLRKGASLGETPDGQELLCRITLNNQLGTAYAAPDDITFAVASDHTGCSVVLEPLRSIALKGAVIDGDGAPIASAAVSISQTLNGKFIKTYTARTDKNGLWAVNVLEAPETRLTYAANECVNRNDTIGSFDVGITELDLGEKMLKSIVGARVGYGFTYREAGSHQTEDYYPDYLNVAISVYNLTQGRAHTDLSLQYPVLAVLDENINAGDKLRLISTSKTGAFCPIEKVVTVGDNQRAEVIFDIVGKGGILATFEMTENPKVIASLYNSNGELVKKAEYSDAAATFTGLEDGSYTLISMGNSDLMSSILRLSNFDEVGLAEGKDYVKNAVNVEAGVLAEVNNSEIPAFDESLFYYTNSATSFTSNKSSITTGNYLTLRAAIDFKGAYKDDISNVALVVDLPEACDFVAQSVIQGPNLLPYTIDNKRLVVQLGNSYTSQTRFCVVPTNGGEFNASAFVEFEYNGKKVTQSIGSAVAQVKDIEIVVPTSTASGTFCVSGAAVPKSVANIFVDGVLTTRVNVNSRGDWSAVSELPECDNFSQHTVYADIATPTGTVLTTETKEIVYNPFDVDVRSVTMTFWNGWYKRQYTVVWDFLNNALSVNKYDFYTTTDITFTIDINYRDLDLIPIVWLNVWTSDGNVRPLIATFDENKNQWVATDKFSSSALPVNVSVTIENMVFAMDEELSYNLLIDDFIGDIQVQDPTEDEDGTARATLTDGDGEELGEILSYETSQPLETVINDFISQGYEFDENLNDDSEYIPVDEDDVITADITAVTDSVTGSIAFIRGDVEGKTQVVIIRLIKEEGKESKTELVSSTISREWKGFYRRYIMNCIQVSEYIKYTEYLDKYVTITTSSMIAYTVFINPALVPTSIIKIPAKQVLCKIRRIKHSTKRYTTKTMEYTFVPLKCTPKPPKPLTPPTPPVDPILDPSGYVYEAVPANRVEGVQASIYYKETKEDMYGDPYDEVILWDAEEYAQKNPLFTDENGMYQWDVPQGLWQVKFEKDGYVTAYSEWLPVPPPQLDVNIGIVQNKQPEVTEARAYEDGIEVQFDKFMDQSTLTTDNIYVTANGEKLAGEIRLVDSSLADEYASEDDASAHKYSSRVRFVPEQKLGVTTGEIRLTVSRNVLSYAGIPMVVNYSQVLDVEKEVTAIYADDVKVLYGGDKEVTISALPYDAAVGRTLHIANASTLIASIDSDTAVLDAEGKATITVKGDLPGSTELVFSIDDVTVTGTCAVDVVTEIVTAEAPMASRASGTAVYRGTKVELTTDAKNADIYFTTDGSCPCDENGTRRKYTVPIVINDDTQILAMTSVGTGADDVSEVVTFNYTLKRSDIDYAMAEGWTWISHNLESDVAVETIAADDNVKRVVGQTQEAVRDPQFGVVGQLTTLKASNSYKVMSAAETSLDRISDVAWNPATPLAINAGWNWLGYPVGQTMSLVEAFAPTNVEANDMIVGQNGFAQYDGEAWVGTLQTMQPGQGYLYKSQSAKSVVYNTSIVSNAAARYAPGLSAKTPLVIDIHKYPDIMPVIATVGSADGMLADNDEYIVNAFCGSECRGIGRVVEGYIMMSVYGNPNDQITFRVTNVDGDIEYANDSRLCFSSNVVGVLTEPYIISVNGQSGISDVSYEGKVKVTVADDMLIIKGVDASEIQLVEVYDMDGHKLIHKEAVADGAIRLPHLFDGVYVVVVEVNGEFTYHKVAIR